MKNQILESYNKMQEMYSPFEKAEQPPAPETDPMDLVTFDIPLLIRLFEFMHEEVQDDAQLHEITTRILEVSKQSEGPLTMENYNEILNGSQEDTQTY